MRFSLTVFEFFEVVHNIILFYVSKLILFATAINKEGQIQPIKISVFLFKLKCRF